MWYIKGRTSRSSEKSRIQAPAVQDTRDPPSETVYLSFTDETRKRVQVTTADNRVLYTIRLDVYKPHFVFFQGDDLTTETINVDPSVANTVGTTKLHTFSSKIDVDLRIPNGSSGPRTSLTLVPSSIWAAKATCSYESPAFGGDNAIESLPQLTWHTTSGWQEWELTCTDETGRPIAKLIQHDHERLGFASQFEKKKDEGDVVLTDDEKKRQRLQIGRIEFFHDRLDNNRQFDSPWAMADNNNNNRSQDAALREWKRDELLVVGTSLAYRSVLRMAYKQYSSSAHRSTHEFSEMEFGSGHGRHDIGFESHSGFGSMHSGGGGGGGGGMGGISSSTSMGGD